MPVLTESIEPAYLRAALLARDGFDSMPGTTLLFLGDGLFLSFLSPLIV